MKNRLMMPPLVMCLLSLSAQAAEPCTVEQAQKNGQTFGAWIDQENWLAPENLRIGLQSAGSFMPMKTIRASASSEPLRAAPRQLDLERITVADPIDQQQRNLGFLFDTRLYADGLLVLRNGKVLSEKYWNGQTGQQPRLLLGGTRPILSLMGAMAVALGKLAPDKSIVRYVPALSVQAGLRKLSIQRLLEGNSRFDWSVQEIDDWQAAGGWKSGKGSGGIRAWLNQPQRWERDFSDDRPGVIDIEPDADLLAWALAETYKESLSNIFCQNVLGKLHAENAAFWLTDQQGTELSGGLALSLRDYARFGKMMIDARNSGNRSKIPTWFIETLTASGSVRKANSPELAGFKKGSESRYGWVHLGGAPNRVAIVGPYGNSLYIDFDHQLVIAIFASYPKNRSAAMLATLEKIWDVLDSATQSSGKR